MASTANVQRVCAQTIHKAVAGVVMCAPRGQSVTRKLKNGHMTHVTLTFHRLVSCYHLRGDPDRYFC